MVSKPKDDREIRLMRSVGLRLRALREASDFSQDALADAVGTSQSALQKWEIGSRWPDIVVLLAICVRCGGDFNWIYQGKYEQLPGDLVGRMAHKRPETFRSTPSTDQDTGKKKA